MRLTSGSPLSMLAAQAAGMTMENTHLAQAPRLFHILSKEP